MKYAEALRVLKQYDKEYAKENEILEAVISVLDYVIEDSENESKEDVIDWVKQVKEEVHPIAFKPDENYTHCDYPHL